MEFKWIIGVDMSKDWFHFCVLNPQLECLWEGQVDNHSQAIFKFIDQLQDKLKGPIQEGVILMEYTGIYVQHLSNSWLSKAGRLAMVAANKISHLLSGQSSWDEKTDQIDARRIAEYGIRYADKLQLWQARDHNIEKLQRLHRQRHRIIQAINLLEVPINESLAFDDKEISSQLFDMQSDSLKALKDDLKKVEQALLDTIQQDENLKHLYKLICSVSGVGPVTAREMIIATLAFKKFRPDQAKAFARYTGVVPLKRSSGKSKKKAKTPARTHSNLKTLLTMGATSLIGTHTDLGHFYERKIAEGKPHFSVINAMRNKLILRIFAVVRKQITYDKELNLLHT